MRISDWSSDVCSSDLPNAAPAAPVATGGPRNETYTRNYEIGKQVSVTKAPMGQVKRVSVAIVMRDTGKGMKAKDIQAIEKLAQSSVGFDARRGDVITVTSRPFPDHAAPEQIGRASCRERVGL